MFGIGSLAELIGVSEVVSGLDITLRLQLGLVKHKNSRILVKIVKVLFKLSILVNCGV